MTQKLQKKGDEAMGSSKVVAEEAATKKKRKRKQRSRDDQRETVEAEVDSIMQSINHAPLKKQILTKLKAIGECA